MTSTSHTESRSNGECVAGSGSASSPPAGRQIRRSFVAWSGVILLVAWAVGQIWRDTNLWTGCCFYLPSPVVCGQLLVQAVWIGWRYGRRWCGVWCALAILPGLFVGFVENHWRQQPPAQWPFKRIAGTLVGSQIAEQDDKRPTSRIVHWNVCWGAYGWDGNVAEIQRLKPDLVVISERPMYAHTLSLVDALGSEYRAYDLRKLVVIARGDVTDLRMLVQTRRSEIFVLNWHWRDQVTRLMTVDLASDIRMPRDPALREVVQLMQTESPDIVVGDFNAPRRSNRLSPCPPGFRHAYDEIGSGWGYTWPNPIPLYSLDQCILGPYIKPTRYEIVSSAHSDHRLQILEFRKMTQGLAHITGEATDE